MSNRHSIGLGLAQTQHPYSLDTPSEPYSDPEDDLDVNEDENLLEKPQSISNARPGSPPGSPGRAESGVQFVRERRSTSLRYLLYTLTSLVLLSAVIGLFAAQRYKGTVLGLPGTRRITMDHMFNGTFSSEQRDIHWVPEAGDGVFSVLDYDDEGNIVINLVDLKTNKTTVLLKSSDIREPVTGMPLALNRWQLSPDMKYVLVKTFVRKQWRWSSFGTYYIHDIAAKKTRPLIPPEYLYLHTDNPEISRTRYATWSPTGRTIAYVYESDLWIVPDITDTSKPPIRLTTTSAEDAQGNGDIFNGVPPWVYEEEIFSSEQTLYFSPTSDKLAFLSFNESAVPEYTFPIYNPTDDNDEVVPYTTDLKMRYPKPGSRNPEVEIWVFDLSGYLASEKRDLSERQDRPVIEHESDRVAQHLYRLDWSPRHEPQNSIIVEVAWVSESGLVVKEVNRNADVGRGILFDLHTFPSSSSSSGDNVITGKVVRTLGKEGEEGDDGWIDNSQSIYPLPAPLLKTLAGSTSNELSAYLDVVPHNGFNHLAIFPSANASHPVFLTSGPWEMTDKIQGVDDSGVVYFIAAKPSSTSRHLYGVKIPQLTQLDALIKTSSANPNGTVAKTELIELTDAETDPEAYYSTRFSPRAGFYQLDYSGPSVPWQKVVKVGDEEFNYVLTTNEGLKNITQQYETPTVAYTTIDSEGYELNVKEMRPPRMDDSGRTKYPVLFRVYGGPFSQLVDLKYQRDWHDYVVCGLSYIVVTVDGRGTGFKGRRLRNTVKGNLGFWETRDQINAAKIWAKKEYVDSKRIGIWGWSYGGFMSSKVVEADAGIHSLAMAVAPVTSWLLYDSIYTERYMNLPSVNPGGYVNASISNVTGFHHVDFLLAHGSGDDNVHFANSAHLLDMFTKEKVRRFRFRMFTDSDHNIMRRGAYRELFEYMTAFLIEKWGKGGRKRGW